MPTSWSLMPESTHWIQARPRRCASSSPSLICTGKIPSRAVKMLAFFATGGAPFGACTRHDFRWPALSLHPLHHRLLVHLPQPSRAPVPSACRPSTRPPIRRPLPRPRSSHNHQRHSNRRRHNLLLVRRHPAASPPQLSPPTGQSEIILQSPNRAAGNELSWPPCNRWGWVAVIRNH